MTLNGNGLVHSAVSGSGMLSATCRYGSVIVGSGHAVASQVLTNDDLARVMDTSDAWIRERTGIRERRVVGPEEHTGTLALEASQRAIEDAGLRADEIDLIIVCTITPEMPLPSTACLLQERLGIAGRGTPAFDLAAACSGFVYGLQAAHGMMQTGLYKHILVVGVEVLSRVTDYTDRGTCILFGDGAGAVVLGRSDDASRGLLYSKLYADGAGWHYICTPGGGTARPPSSQMLADKDHLMKMKGREVYKFAVTRMQMLVDEAVAACGLDGESISLVVPHQVNKRIIDSAVEKLNLPPERVYVNIDRFGNTSSASIPIAFDEARRAGKIKAGDLILMVAFGAGLTWGSAVVRM